jgi:L-iditol 2-dehydrogenase
VNRTPLRGDECAVVVGAGIIGLLAIQALRAAGCARVLAVDLDARRLELATELGAEAVLRADETDVPEEVRKLTGGQGADLAIEAVGVAAALDTALACVRKGGQVTLVGNLAPSVPFPLQKVVTRELTLHGSCASAGEYPACLDLMARGVVRVEPLISAVVPLGEGAACFARLQRGEAGLMKVILRP